jgi:exodeoxyribonuclease I
MTNFSKNSFLWHDYETWGINPAFNGPAQFAAIRTDQDLNPIGDPIMLYCRPNKDALPQPEACLITGITPQEAEYKGLNEAEFVAQIHQTMMQSNTCSVGYNNIRFDDEVTRFALYRNFYDAYEREWKNGNSRWDLLDVVRFCAALRPEGIQWPMKDGVPSYRLEAITAANNIEHQGAHDALVDVRATIAVAQLIKTKQPKLFEYALSLRDKVTVSKVLELGSQKPIFHVSSMFGNANYCASILLPLAIHPSNRNSVICFDLRYDPSEFLQLDGAELQRRLFSSYDESAGESRIPIKNIHINKAPMVVSANAVTEKNAQRIHLDLAKVKQHYQLLSSQFSEHHQALLQQAFSSEREFIASDDVDAMLYSGSFFSDSDKRLMQQVRQSTPEQLQTRYFDFSDPRLNELLWRYRARNWPELLTEQEQVQWQAHCQQRLHNPPHASLLSIEQYQEKLEALFMQHENDEQKSAILSDLMDWADALV